jgi:cyclase
MFASSWSHVEGPCWAWVQGDGGWGLSNAGVIVGDREALLVDTLFDLPSTRTMLDAMPQATGGVPITRLVNTHGNGDHWFGNQLVRDVEIIAAEGAVEDMLLVGPDQVAGLLGLPDPTGAYVRSIFGRFNFDGITPTYPSRTFTCREELLVGGWDVELIDVGPAHTLGDTIVHVPAARTVYTGDIVFAGGTPLIWAGPAKRWLDACCTIIDLGVEHVVPGHGPVGTIASVRAMVDYVEYVHERAIESHARGMGSDDAARSIDLGPFARWPESERLAVNVRTIYRELDRGVTASGPELFGCMAALHEHLVSA